MKKLLLSIIFTTISFTFFVSCGSNSSVSRIFPSLGNTKKPYFPVEITEPMGTEGGTVVITEEKSSAMKTFVSIPEGALTGSKEITVKTRDPEKENLSFNGKKDQVFIEFGPHGTEFEKPVQIGIPYHNIENEGNLSIFYLNEEKNLWEPMPLLAIDRENGIVIAETRHFSTYTVASTNIILDVNLYKDTDNLFGYVKLLTPMEDITLGSDGQLNEIVIAEPLNIRAAYRVSLKKQTFALPDPIGEWFDRFVPPVETKTHYYRIDSMMGPMYSVETEDGSGTVLFNSLTRGMNLDFSGMEQMFSGEPVLFNFDMPNNDTKKYYFTVDLYYLKNGATLDTATADDIWGGQGYRIVGYSGAQHITAVDPVTDIDQNGDGVVDQSSSGFNYDQLPQVSITAPDAGQSIIEATEITFTGSAIDTEDGPLSGTQLSWSSDLDGDLGSGSSISISTLSIGVHTITLSAKDSVDNTGTATIVLSILPEPPVITAQTPGAGASGVSVSSSVYISFSKDMDDTTINQDTFIVRDEEGTALAGLYQYSNKVASFTPAAPFEYGKNYTVTVTTGVKDAGGTEMAAEAAWSFLSMSCQVEIEDAAFVNNGTAYFGGPLNRMAKADGTALFEGADYSYNYDLLAVYDSTVSGAFQADRFMRIVENSLNIADAGGLSLTPVAADLTEWQTPGEGQCYIDPERSKFVMPRPSYWSRMENLESLTDNAEISAPASAPASEDAVTVDHTALAGAGSTETFSDGKFSTCLHKEWSANGDYVSAHGTADGGRKIFPFGSTPGQDIRKGTISFWGKSDVIVNQHNAATGGHAYAEWRLISDIAQVRIYNKLEGSNSGADTFSNMQAEIIYDGTVVAGPVEIGPGSQWYHFYVAWDADTAMDGKHIIVYADNTEILSTDTAPTGLDSTVPYFEVYGKAYGFGATVPAIWTGLRGWYTAKSDTDNIKWFNHAVSYGENAAQWEYNEGNGREDALHAMYSADSGHTPVLTGTTSGVGYFYLPDTSVYTDAPSVPANLIEESTGHPEVRLAWAGSIDTDGTVIGYNVYRSLTSGSGYEKIASVYDVKHMDDTAAAFTDYYYMVRAVDDQGIESPDSPELHVAIEPDIYLLQNGTLINDGDEIIIKTLVRSHKKTQFTISNRGDIDLEMTGTPKVEITGPDAACFTVSEEPAINIAANTSNTFTIDFTPDTPGEKSATFTVLSTDSNNGSISFTIQGTGYYGKMDMGVYNPSPATHFLPGGNFQLAHSTGNGEFRHPANYQWGNYPDAQAMSGDFNGDGNFDLCLYNPEGNGEFRMRNRKDSNSLTEDIVYTWESGGKSFTGDFNGDGYFDIGLYNLNNDGNIRIRYSDGGGNFSSETIYSWTASETAQVFAGDFNGDGNFDIGLFNEAGEGNFKIRFGDGTGLFSPVDDMLIPRWELWPEVEDIKNCTFGICNDSYDLYQDHSKVTCGDYDGDGLWDLGILYVNKYRQLIYDPFDFDNIPNIPRARYIYDMQRSGHFITRFNNGSNDFTNQKSYYFLNRENSLLNALLLSYHYSGTTLQVEAIYSYIGFFKALGICQAIYNWFREADRGIYNSNIIQHGTPISGNFDME